MEFSTMPALRIYPDRHIATHLQSGLADHGISAKQKALALNCDYMRRVYLIVISIFFGLAISCSNNSSTKKITETPIPTESNQIANPEKIILKTYISIFKYDSTYEDSSLVYKKWFSGDSIVKTFGNFYYNLPIQSEFVDNRIIKYAKGQTLYETFDSMICEVGGHSAWNKYIFTYDEKKRPILVSHYKAWYESVDEKGNFYTNKTPKYFLGEQINFLYSDNKIIQIAKNDSGKILEKITKQFDTTYRLIFEEWDAWDEYRYRIYYNPDE